MSSPFSLILRRAIHGTPHAIAGSFAAGDGELVEAVAIGDLQHWALLTAHYGVILGHLEAALGTWHYGGTEYFVAYHERVSVVVHTVDAGYFALLAVRSPAPVDPALVALRVAARELREEMRA